jgi:hypothetical protein
MSKEITIPDEIFTNKIYFIREKKVMLDSDLAELYGVETKYLKQAVKRNIDIFPVHFMFELTQDENESLRSQFVTSKKGRGGTRYLPMVFTEHGILQLSHVLRSKRARLMSVRITEVFIQMREVLTDNLNLKLAIEDIKKKLTHHSKNIELVFNYLDELIDKKENEKPRTKVGYKKD